MATNILTDNKGLRLSTILYCYCTSKWHFFWYKLRFEVKILKRSIYPHCSAMQKVVSNGNHLWYQVLVSFGFQVNDAALLQLLLKQFQHFPLHLDDFCWRHILHLLLVTNNAAPQITSFNTAHNFFFWQSFTTYWTYGLQTQNIIKP